MRVSSLETSLGDSFTNTCGFYTVYTNDPEIQPFWLIDCDPDPLRKHKIKKSTTKIHIRSPNLKGVIYHFVLFFWDPLRLSHLKVWRQACAYKSTCRHRSQFSHVNCASPTLPQQAELRSSEVSSYTWNKDGTEQERTDCSPKRRIRSICVYCPKSTIVLQLSRKKRPKKMWKTENHKVRRMYEGKFSKIIMKRKSYDKAGLRNKMRKIPLKLKKEKSWLVSGTNLKGSWKVMKNDGWNKWK